MRGRKRAATRFNNFRNEILERYATESRSHDFIRFLKELSESQFESIIFRYCDEDEALIFDQAGFPVVLYQIFRLADKVLLLRDFETLHQAFTGKNSSLVYNELYEAIVVLISTNQISYTTRDFDDSPSNTLQLFIKDE